MNRKQLFDQLERHEGLKLKPYTDTVGKLTIGVGRNLDDVGISHGEAMLMLSNDVEVAEKELRQRFPIVKQLDETRYHVLINMCFNMGVTRLAGFQKMWFAIEAQDWPKAALEMLDSKWARQVGNRAIELSTQMREG